MYRYTVLGLAIGLLVGGLFGHQIGRAGRLRDREPVVAAPASGPAAPPAMQGGAPAEGLEVQQRIQAAQQLLARDPKDVRTWVQLGNDYFDTHQPQKAVAAYQRALELEPNDPNVLTDQGIMYRELRQFDKALANFESANRIEPKHVQSLFNAGVVYAYDLKDAARAERAWNDVVRIAPASSQAAQARQALEQLAAKP